MAASRVFLSREHEQTEITQRANTVKLVHICIYIPRLPFN